MKTSKEDYEAMLEDGRLLRSLAKEAEDLSNRIESVGTRLSRYSKEHGASGDDEECACKKGKKEDSSSDKEEGKALAITLLKKGKK